MTQHPKARPQKVRGKLGKSWIGQWREADGKKRNEVLGLRSEMTKAEAQIKLDALVAPSNIDRAVKKISGSTTLAAYVEGVFLPHKVKSSWKGSTVGTSRDRITYHVVKGELGPVKLRDLSRHNLQAFLDARKGLAKNTLKTLKFDLTSILDLAVSDGLVSHNRARSVLEIPKEAKAAEQDVMTVEEVSAALKVLPLRERLFLRLALYSGMRPGEISVLRWCDVEGLVATVGLRVYRGKIDTTKTSKVRRVALPGSAAPELSAFREFAREKDAFIFESERKTPMSYANLMTRHIRPLLITIGLGWVNFLVTRRTNATLMSAAEADPKVAADNRGHGIGVSLDTYTQSTDKQKAAAIQKLEGLIQ